MYLLFPVYANLYFGNKIQINNKFYIKRQFYIQCVYLNKNDHGLIEKNIYLAEGDFNTKI